MDQPQDYVREKFSGTGLMFLFCVACGKLIAYSARADVLAIAEAAHAKSCDGPMAPLPPAADAPGPQPAS